MPVVHIRRLSGAGAEKWLAFARSKLRDWNWFGEGSDVANRNQTFVLPGVTIHLEQTGEFQFIDIIAGGIAFEFLASNKVDGYYYATPGRYAWQVGLPFGLIEDSGVRVNFQPDPSPSPIFSNILVPTDGPQWPHRDITNIGFSLATQSEDYFKTWASWQFQGVGEAVYYPDNKPDFLLTSTWGTTNGRASLSGHGDYHWSDVVGGLRPPYDAGYDIAPTLYGADGSVNGVLGPYFGDACWWRHAAVKEVDGRKFFIVGDNKGRLHFYPVKPYYTDQNVIDQLQTVLGAQSAASLAIPFKTVTPDYPAWVSLSPVDDVDPLLWWNWSFNKDASKAATIALHAQDRPGYFFYRDNEVPVNSFNQFDPYNSVTWRAYLTAQFSDSPHAIFATSKKGPAPRELTPGLVEISIDLTVTGDGDMDFTPTVTVLRNDYFGDSGRYYQDCAYLIKDPRINGEDNALPEGTLVTSELQVYNTDGNWYVKLHDDPLTPLVDERFVPASDPLNYINGTDKIECVCTSVWVIRRQDTDAEIRRQLLSYLEGHGDWFFPIDAPNLNAIGADGYGGFEYISGIWLHNALINDAATVSDADNQPQAGQGPFAGKFRYGVIVASDLRSLSYIVGRTVYDFTSTKYINLDLTWVWRPHIRHETYQYDLTVFNEHQAATAFTQDAIYVSSDYLLGAIPQGFVTADPVDEGDQEPTVIERNTIDKAATAVYSSVAINFIGLSPHRELKIHPKGHWSAMLLDGGGVGIIDRLNLRGDGVDHVTTHREMFNQAFGQARENAFYDGIGEYGFESGSFRLSGLWLPYKDTA